MMQVYKYVTISANEIKGKARNNGKANVDSELFPTQSRNLSYILPKYVRALSMKSENVDQN